MRLLDGDFERGEMPVIEGMDYRGRISTARMICDDCGKAEVVPCRYVGKVSLGTSRPDPGQVHRKAVGMGWAITKGKLRCPSCEAKRKAASAKPQWLAAAETAIKQEAEMAKTEAKTESASVTPIRRPTPKQERLIILALEDAYDDTAKRYRGSATDKTLADDLGDGVMFGWVAEIRERLFGPSGGNEEIEAIKAEIAASDARWTAAIKAAEDRRKADMAAITKRQDAICAAVGPRARAV
jgi:hypothetical protein